MDKLCVQTKITINKVLNKIMKNQLSEMTLLIMLRSGQKVQPVEQMMLLVINKHMVTTPALY